MPMTGTSTADRAFTPAYIAARSGKPEHRVTPADAFAAARDVYFAGERLDMRELAARLGVGRTTLYRWCGDRQQLLTDVIWSVTEDRIRAFEEATEDLRGRARLREGVRLFMEASAHDPALHALFRNERHGALRLMTVEGDGRTHHDRLIAELTMLLVQECEREDMELRASPRLVATTIVRVMEGFIYNNAIAEVEPRLEEASEVLDFLLS
jgi:AcrR family transcriptional regulator